MIGLFCLRELGLRSGITEQLPGNKDVWEVFIRPVMWIVSSAVMCGRSKNWRRW